MSKAIIRAEMTAQIEKYLANGGTITRLAPGRKTKDTLLNKFGVSAWGRTATIANAGRQYNLNRVDVAGSNTNRAA